MVVPFLTKFSSFFNLPPMDFENLASLQFTQKKGFKIFSLIQPEGGDIDTVFFPEGGDIDMRTARNVNSPWVCPAPPG